MFCDTGNDRVDIPAQHFRGIADRFPPPELQIVLTEEERLSTELRHSGLKRNPCAGTRMLEDHPDCLAGQVGVRFVPFVHPLQSRCGGEHLTDFVGGEIGILEKAATFQARSNREYLQLRRGRAPQR